MGRLTSLPSSVVTDDSALGGAVIENSLRVSTTDSSYLTRTPSSAGNRRTFTISLWVKRSSMSGSAVFGAYISNSNRATLRFASGDVIEFQHAHSSNESVKTNATFRDTNSWYHIVCAIDTTQASQSDRGKIYVNGVQQTLQSNNLTQNIETSVNNNSVQTFGTRWIGSYNGGFDGYLAEVNLIDGLQLDPTYFGYTEFQTGIWRPKGYFGSYGTNGVRLDFSDNSATTAITLGKDRSGQGNDYTPINLSVSAGAGNDSFPESPTAKKEFATLNSNLQKGGGADYRQGNYSFYSNDDGTVQTRANMSRSSGKWYAEFTLSTYTARSGSYPYVGVAQAENFSNTWTGSSGTAYQSQGGIWRNGSNIESGYSTYTAGDVISVAINLDSSPPQVWWAKNGSYIRSGANPSTLTAGVNIEPASTSGTYTFTASLFANPGQWDVNFGQRPFVHSVPTGFKTLNTDNFSINTPTIIRPQKHFDVLLYTPNSSNLRVTGLEFKPDLVWAKSRTQAYSHYLFDSVRGTGQRGMKSNTTDVQGTDTTKLTSFDEGGFTVPVSGINDNGSGTNGVVAWCWRGGKPKVATTGSIYLDGTTDYLIVGGHSDLDLGTGNFTIEGYFNSDKNTNSTIICSNNYYTAGTNGNWLFRISNANQVAFASYDGNGNAEYSEFSYSIKRNKWHHFALVREGTGSNEFKIYIDGNSIGAMTVSKSLSGGTTGLGIGDDLSGTNHEFEGNISNIRIIKGTALYTSNFTVPTSPLTNITNTKLLCCQSLISATTATVSPTSITAAGNVRSDEKNQFDAFSVDGVGYASASAAGITEGNLAITGASINREAGFSIVTYDANNNASATIGHGLNSKPELVIVKDASNSDDWQCKFINDNMYVPLNDNNAGSTSYGNYTATDTLINLGYTWNNGSGIHVAYSWTSIPGYSKIGRYNALGSTDGAYIELGFRPAFILIRPTNNFGGGDQNYSTWGLFDSTRGTTNPVTYAAMLTANTNYLEQRRGNNANNGALDAFDILGTGFKVRNSAYEVGYSGVYFYMAFAEQAGQSPYHTDTNAR